MVMKMNRYEREITNDEPINLHKLDIYPITMRNYFDFVISSSILKIRKNVFNDIRFIPMSYLDFLITIIVEKDEEIEQEKKLYPEKENQINHYSTKLYRILSISLNRYDFQLRWMINENGKYIIAIDDIILDCHQFDEIRDLILSRNNIVKEEEILDEDLAKD